MKTNTLGLSLYLTLFAGLLNAQVFTAPVISEDYLEPYRESKTYFIGFHGYSFSAGEIFQVQTKLFEDLISN